MSASNAEGVGMVSGLEQIVVDYLKLHPDFFSRHADLLTDLEVFHPCGRAVSLIEYQVVVLRDQNHQVRRRLQGLVATARENEELSERVHRLTLELVACGGLREACETLYRALRESFGAEHAAVRLFVGPAAESDAGFAEFLGPDERARRLLAPILGVASPLCGRIPADQLQVLFGATGAQVGSGALLPLGVDARIGVLAIGSSDENRYQPGMATTFLRQLADIASQVMRPFLAAPDGGDGCARMDADRDEARVAGIPDPALEG